MSTNNNKITEIQALRAIAVVLVVLYHGGITWFSGGYIGVDVFFVISGYLITGLLVREHTSSGTINFLKFYARRIRRLFPAAAVVVAAVCVAGWYLYSPLEFKQLTSTAITTSIYISNVWFFQLATDYLAVETHTNPLLHTWSLSVEEQFYLFWPLLIISLTKLSRSSDATRQLVIGLAILALVSLALCVLQTKSNQPLAFFGTHARAWEFGIGGMLALAHTKGVTIRYVNRNLTYLAGLLLIFVPSIVFNDTTVFPGFYAFWPVLGTALVIHSCGGGGESNFNGWMKLKPVQYVGDISYSLYLWHWPVTIFAYPLVEKIGLIWTPSYLVISLALAALSYHFVENPVRFSSLLTSKPANSYYFGLGVSGLILCSIMIGRLATVSELEDKSQVSYRNARIDIPIIYDDGCHLNQIDTSISEHCIYGRSDSNRSIVLFGDSHAANWFPALEKLASDQGYSLYSITKSSCPSLFFEPFNQLLKRQYTECSIWRENALEFIADIRPDLVIFGNSDRYFMQDNGNVDLKNLTSALARTRDWIDDSSGISFVVMRDIPRMNFDPLNCLSRAAWKRQESATTCKFFGTDQASTEIFGYFEAEFEGAGRVMLLDMNRNICPAEGSCLLERGELIVFRDTNHITASFSEHLSPILLKELQKAKFM